MIPVPDSVKQRLVCPVCKGALTWREADTPPGVDCTRCAVTYPFADGIPVLLRDRATPTGLHRL